MAKAGRPKTPQDAKREPGISIRLTNEEYKSISLAAGKCGLTISDWSRKSLIYAANGGNDVK